jgi:hypothetical protein
MYVAIDLGHEYQQECINNMDVLNQWNAVWSAVALRDVLLVHLPLLNNHPAQEPSHADLPTPHATTAPHSSKSATPSDKNDIT